MAVPIVFEGGARDGYRTMWDADNPPMWINLPTRIESPFGLDFAGRYDSFDVSHSVERWRRVGRLDRSGAHVYRLDP